MTPAEQLAALRARAARLEQQLSEVILDLDPSAVERLAQIALSIGFTEDEVAAVFGPSFVRNLNIVWRQFAQEAADDMGLRQTDVSSQAEAAIQTRLSGLTAEAQKVVEDLVSTAADERWEVERLARALFEQLPLTAQQNAYVANFEVKLRTDKRLALRNRLRDRRGDRALRSDKPLPETRIQRMVDAYRENWRRARSMLVARQELGRAANATLDATFVQALQDGRLDPTVRKHWIHMHDDRVRTAHLDIPEMNPDGVPVDAAFDSPLGPIRYPLDPEADPANTISCRCGLIYSGLPSG